MTKKDMDARHFDKRLFERFISRGAVSQQDFDKHLSTLPDLAGEADDIADLVYASRTDPEPTEPAPVTDPNIQ